MKIILLTWRSTPSISSSSSTAKKKNMRKYFISSYKWKINRYDRGLLNLGVLQVDYIKEHRLAFFSLLATSSHKGCEFRVFALNRLRLPMWWSNYQTINVIRNCDFSVQNLRRMRHTNQFTYPEWTVSSYGPGRLNLFCVWGLLYHLIVKITPNTPVEKVIHIGKDQHEYN